VRHDTGEPDSAALPSLSVRASTAPSPRVLIVEHDPGVAEAIVHHLRNVGLAPLCAGSEAEALSVVAGDVDLVLLDLNVPGLDGLEVCHLIRRHARNPRVPIVIVSAQVDRLLGLEIGEDDHVITPLSMRDLTDRCLAALRRQGGTSSGPRRYRDRNFLMDFDSYLVLYLGEEVRLTVTELRMLQCLVEQPGRVMTRDDLGRRVWGPSVAVASRTINAHITRIRRKLGPARKHLETVVGRGYRFVSDPEASQMPARQ
jgi:two-component system phosphate regulon response regulator PhoB